MLKLEVLIRKLGAIDRLAAHAFLSLVLRTIMQYHVTPTISLGKITTLNHEIFDDTMERGALITESWLTSRELPKLS